MMSFKKILLKENWPVDHPWGVPDTDNPDSENYEPYDYEGYDHYIQYCPYCRGKSPVTLVGKNMLVCKTCRSEWIASEEDMINRSEAEDASDYEMSWSLFYFPDYEFRTNDPKEAYTIFKEQLLDKMKDALDFYDFPTAASVFTSVLRDEAIHTPYVVNEKDDDISDKFLKQFRKEWMGGLRDQFQKENGGEFRKPERY